MYADGLSFLDEERDAWRPFEALLELTDEQLERPLDGAHGWTGRDLMAHLGVWIEWWLKIARELAVSPNKLRPATSWHEIGGDWEAQGDALNAATRPNGPPCRWPKCATASRLCRANCAAI